MCTAKRPENKAKKQIEHSSDAFIRTATGPGQWWMIWGLKPSENGQSCILASFMTPSYKRFTVSKILSNSSPLTKKRSFHNPTGSSARTKTLFKKVIPKAAGRRAQLLISPFSFLQIEVGTVSNGARFLCHPPLPRKSMRACQDVVWHSCSQNKTKEH